jgi:pimeloyl-ACP methyl ester carboxylesterase
MPRKRGMTRSVNSAPAHQREDHSDADASLLTDYRSTINGLRIFSRVSVRPPFPAEHALPIVHVHGFGISGRYLEPTARLLARYYPTYIPDLPGHGRSERPPRQPGIPELAKALLDYVDAMNLSRVVLLGNSMGCLIAAEFAHRFPERIERSVLVSPAGGPHNQPLARAAAQLARDGIREPFSLARIALPDYARFGIVNTVRAFRRMTRYPTTERLSTLPVPFLAIIGNNDPLISVPQLMAIFASPADVDLVYHFDSAHAINYSHPEALARVTHAYLQGHPLRELFTHGGLVAHIDDRVSNEIS